MAAAVAIYFCWPDGSALMARYAVWQHAGGLLAAALAMAFAGGALSEISLVYFRDKGVWTRRHVENMLFKLAMFFISGITVYEFYQWQAVWFGNGPSWSVLLPKILIDQFVYTRLLVDALQHAHDPLAGSALLRVALMERAECRFYFPAHASRPRHQLDALDSRRYVFYSMPLDLQTPLCVFATAIWGILLAAGIGRPSTAKVI